MRGRCRILVFACLGVYSLSGSGYEVLMALLIGVAGFFMRKLDFPIAPVVLGVILGPTMEEQFRRALVISNGDASVFFTRPLSLVPHPGPPDLRRGRLSAVSPETFLRHAPICFRRCGVRGRG
ncbi:tripartite tricarboxylate transporter permease [Kribbella shirazensis]|uniref:Na+/proline symporter n=1 Tax=Kribbella shirazensis TaxID=1105143 RepID=A0A7X6A2M7_9ACTN|nr:Na+/proline symporter [Kribbella shirazensis]